MPQRPPTDLSRPLTRLVLAAAAFVAACQQGPLALPAPPATQERPTVDHVAPLSGIAGSRVTVHGSGFGATAKVRFAERGETRPLSVAADGSSLEVRVPEEARTGTVSVLVDGFEAVGSETFTFAGLDRLRHLRIQHAADLRPVVSRVLALGNGQATVSVAAAPYASVATEGALGPLPGSEVTAIAAADDADTLFLVDLDVVIGGCTGAGTVWEVRSPTAASPTVRKACLESGPAQSKPAAIAVDPAGGLALVVADDRVWFIDWTKRPQPAVVAFDNDGADLWSVAVWATGDRFLVGGGGDRLWPVSPSGAGEPWVVDAGTRSGVVVTALGAGGGLVALGTDAGEVVTFRADRWPPQSPSLVTTLSGDPVTGLGLAPSGSRLLVSQQGFDGNGRVATFDPRETPPLPLAVVRLDAPGEVTFSKDGAALVGVRGGYGVLSTPSGALSETRSLSSRLRSFARRRVPSFFGPPRDTIELAARAYNRTLALDPKSLEVQWDLAIRPDPAAGPLETIAAAPGGTRFFLDHQTSLRRTAADGTLREDPAELKLPAGLRLHELLVVAPDGQTVAGLMRDAGGQDAGVLLVDARTAWTGETPRTLTVPGEPVQQLLFDGAGRLVLGTARTVRLLEVATALAGDLTPVWPPVVFADVDWVRAAGGQLLVSDHGTLWRIDAANGRATAVGPLPDSIPLFAQGVASVQLSPGGHSLYWIRGGGDAAVLHTLRLDPDTFEPLGEEAVVEFPAGSTSLDLDPDGEHAVVMDGFAGRIYLVE